ncbi:excinuclease ABC subunit UvrB [Schleiferiaceae bacterium]|jgi:excinuclease ABC subunit B|nr:excinuclease ABC subunit UvrB [Schleiferiaceae bacterium]MDB2473505.1 excinuclease ABC subunit UvrB [Schleiferiaceae bacterium]
MNFKLKAPFEPMGDQPTAIDDLVEGLSSGERNQVLLGVTGSGKTFTVANVIERTQRPSLILCHNKTLAAQLYGEMKEFFPENAVEYFVSYYDYYQPEAYVPSSGLYIEKDLSINDEIEKLRLSTTSSLLSGRRDVIVVASVSCLYGMGNPEAFNASVVDLKVGETISRQGLLHKFVNALYSRTTAEFKRGSFRVKGDTVDIFPAYAETYFRISFWGDEIESIEHIDPVSGLRIEHMNEMRLFPANLFVTEKNQLQQAIHHIQDDLMSQVDHFRNVARPLEAKRLEERTNFDLEMIRELGYCSGIENYSRYLDGRAPGVRPFCLLDYFPDDFLLVIDESHVTIPQVRAMYGGDRSRKENLVEYGFRLPAALDNRPLKFEEFENLRGQALFVSATPADYELQLSGGVFAEQVIRPTGLLDPNISVRPSKNQVDDLMDEIHKRVEIDERVLVTTLTKRMAEELTKYFTRYDIRCRYIHSDVDTLERVEIMRDLRLGVFDVLIGVNLLREGLDFPEVSLVAIMDADKEGFLRSERSLVQTIGRAARNVNGLAILYADKVTDSMQRTIDETKRRREKQDEFNKANGLVPQALQSSREEILSKSSAVGRNTDYEVSKANLKAAEKAMNYIHSEDLEGSIRKVRKEMEKASKTLDFIEAARLRDVLIELEGKREKR